MTERYNSGFVDIVEQINNLVNGDKEDEYGLLRPTENALRKTKTVLDESFTTITVRGRRAFPRGAVTTDEVGGLRIEWAAENLAVRLVVSAEEIGKSYIYHERGDQYATTGTLSGSVLVRYLREI